MTIQSIRVANKVTMDCERFQKWVYANQEYVVGKLKERTGTNDAVLFALDNSDYLTLTIRGKKDRLALTGYGGVKGWYSITYLEHHVSDEMGGEYFDAMCTEDFPHNRLDLAMRCFMERWESQSPEKPSSVPFTYNTISKQPIHDPIDVTMTPEQVKLRLEAQRLACGAAIHASKPWDANRIRACLDSTKHLDINDRYTSRRCAGKLAIKATGIDYGPEGMVTIFSDGVITELGKSMMRPTDGSVPVSGTIREMAESAGINVIEPRHLGTLDNKGNWL